jgi:hypothetical protein
MRRLPSATGFGVSVAPSLAVLLAVLPARAQEPATVDLQRDMTAAPPSQEISPPPEAPPPAPYQKTLVLDSSLGARAFLGDFGQTAPPGMWLHTQLGYEVLRWLMLFGEGDLSFNDTSGTQPAPRTRAFPVFGFGGGARFTARFTPRVGAYVQLSVGAMKADVPANALALIGFREAETLSPYGAARLGVEWYQINRHFALGLNSGLRLAQGFAPSRGGGAAPLVLDGGASLRYAF